MTLIPSDNPDPGIDDMEIVHVYETADSGASSDSVHRGMEGTTAKDWPAGALVRGRVTARALGVSAVIIEDAGASGWRALNISSPSDPIYTIGDQVIGIGIGYDSTPVVAGVASISIGAGGAGGITAISNNQADMINLGRGGVIDGASVENSINIGAGGVADYDDGGTLRAEDAISMIGAATGPRSISVGRGGSDQWSINIGAGGASPGATSEADGSLSIGNNLGAYTLRSINIGNSTGGGPGGADSVVVGSGTAETTAANTVALGSNAVAGHADSVAVGESSETTASSQIHVGDRDLELGTATSQRGVHIYSPDGTRYKLTVDDTGSLQVAADPL